MAKMKTLTVSGQTYTVCDPEAVRSVGGQRPDEAGNVPVTDDSLAGNLAWSGKHIADSLCPSFSENGVVVTCVPVEGYPLEITAQADATNITRCGKNLAKADASREVDVGGGIAVTVTKDSAEIVVNGTATKNHSMVPMYSIIIPPGTYTASAEGLAEGNYINGNTIDGDYVFRNLRSGFPVTFTTAGQAAVKITTVFLSGSAYNETPVRIQIECGGTATAYAPYSGDTFLPGEDVPALAGVNTLYADCGAITVAGKANPSAIIEKLTNAIVSLGGNV